MSQKDEEEWLVFKAGCNRAATQYFIEGLTRWYRFDQDKKHLGWMDIGFLRSRISLAFYQAVGLAGLPWKDEYNIPFNDKSLP